MQYVAFLVILVGVYLIDSGLKNRAPIGFLTALLSSDSPDLRKTLSEFDGKWHPPLATTAPAGTAPAGNSPGGGPGLGESNDPRNGRYTDAELTRLSWNGIKVANAAAPSLEQLNKAYREEFGMNMQISGGYRSFAQQVATKAAKGNMAATPGKSNHGTGNAVDISGGVNSFGTRQYRWMMENAPRFGWVNPGWAQQNGSKPEPWHWEFVGGSGVSV